MCSKNSLKLYKIKGWKMIHFLLRNVLFSGGVCCSFWWRIFFDVAKFSMERNTQLGSYIFGPETVQLVAMCVATFDITLDFPGP